MKEGAASTTKSIFSVKKRTPRPIPKAISTSCKSFSEALRQGLSTEHSVDSNESGNSSSLGTYGTLKEKELAKANADLVWENQELRATVANMEKSLVKLTDQMSSMQYMMKELSAKQRHVEVTQFQQSTPKGPIQLPDKTRTIPHSPNIRETETKRQKPGSTTRTGRGMAGSTTRPGYGMGRGGGIDSPRQSDRTIGTRPRALATAMSQVMDVVYPRPAESDDKTEAMDNIHQNE